ncbi:ankyrin repeat domain-containing protein, partial [Candidatus Bathyarchaeota archaeon]|nr:ankyrin repeat domain-containing protein [Candidatus Bathyarchaeota archaeon]
MDATIDTVCWLALERGTGTPGYRVQWDTSRERGLAREYIKHYPDLSLLSAATYLHHVSLVKELLAEGHCPTARDDLFPSAMHLAAWAGHADLLELFQEQLPEFEKTGRYPKDWRAKVGRGSLLGASQRGDMDMVRLAAYPPSRAAASDPGKATDFVNIRHGEVEANSPLGTYLYIAASRTSSWEVRQYIMAFLSKNFDGFLNDDDPLGGSLKYHATSGNLDMVRHLLDAGADVHGGKGYAGSPLLQTVRACHEDVVDLLLERGADPNKYGLSQHGTTLAAASGTGSMRMFRKLLDHGAKIIEEDGLTLMRAVLVEHTALVEMLLDLG